MRGTTKGRILNVDDDEGGRDAVTRLLRGAGYTVDDAATGAEALRLAAEQPPDLIILDVQLPDIDGFEVRRRLKADPATASVPIMHLSATALDSDSIAAGLEGGADAYLIEPVEAQVLLATVKALLRAHAAEKALRESQTLLQALADGIPDPIYVKDQDSRIIMANPALATVVGRPLDEIVGRTDSEYYGDEAVGRALREHDLRVMASGQSEAMEETVPTPQGERTFLSTKAPRRDASGRIVGIIGISRDITERKQAELLLTASEERLANIIASSPIDIALIGLDGTFIEVNPAALELHGFAAREELIGKDCLSLVEEKYHQKVAENWEKVLSGGSVRDVELVQLKKDGSRIDTLVSVTRLDDTAGNPYALLAMVLDITERKRAEEALRESRERFRLIASSTPDHLLVQDRELRYVLVVNPQLGLTEGDMIGRTDYDILSKDDADRLTAIKRGVLETGVPVHLEAPLSSAAGEVEFFEGSYVPRSDADGHVDGLIGYFRNVTDRTRAEDALRRSERRWATTLASIGDAVIATDAEGTVTFLNATAEALTGWTPAEAVGKPVGEVFHIINEYTRAEVEDPVVKVLREGTVVGLANHTVLLRRDGTEIPIDDSGAPIRGANGKTAGVVLVFRDITERKQAEEGHALLQSELERQAQLLDTLVEATESRLAYYDRDLRYVRVNRAYAASARMAPEQFVGRHRQEVFPTTDAVSAVLERVVKTGEAETIPEYTGVPHYRPEAGPRCLRVDAAPVRNRQGEVEGVVTATVDITDQVQARARLVEAERARAELAEGLRDEIAHRVKNNLAMVSGLLQMQLLGEQDPRAAASLRDAASRIRTFVSLHERLYATAGDEVDLLGLLRHLGASTAEVFGVEGPIEILVDGDTYLCVSRIATNLSVIANELITNALKHGERDVAGLHKVHLRLDCSPEELRLSVWNSGNPVAEGFDPSRQQGVGLRLVSDIVIGQYQGRVTIAPSSGGTRAEVCVPQESLRLEARPR